MEKLYNNKAISLPFLYTVLLPTYGPGTAGERFHSLAGDFSSSVYEGQRWGISNMMSHLLGSETGNLVSPAAGTQEGRGARGSSWWADLDRKSYKSM